MGLEDLRVALCASKLVNYDWVLPSQHLDGILPGHKLSNSGSNMLLFWDRLANRKWEVAYSFAASAILPPGLICIMNFYS
ncbi:hypothetical protein Bca4012_054495 [Brassica carinata]|uniref:Uncharacterized protein n=1 Tax=Brassica carinata TaxID=52824 RepID=A0A8X7VX02_BRACI|nr:hypothetical protein Bca52824_012444 [Brassica carinata]